MGAAGRGCGQNPESGRGRLRFIPISFLIKEEAFFKAGLQISQRLELYKGPLLFSCLSASVISRVLKPLDTFLLNKL